MKKVKFGFGIMSSLVLGGVLFFMPAASFGHCDTLDGPVVAEARAALESGDITAVLKWVKKNDEKEIREVFAKTLSVRKQGAEAKELADRYFFETLVRLHRAGEGAPYTGLKPASAVDHAVAEADKALDSGSADRLLKMLSDAASDGIRKRFRHALEARKKAETSVEAGRKFVEAYVEFTHYVERLHADIISGAGHANEAKTPAAEEHHRHEH